MIYCDNTVDGVDKIYDIYKNKIYKVFPNSNDFYTFFPFVQYTSIKNTNFEVEQYLEYLKIYPYVSAHNVIVFIYLYLEPINKAIATATVKENKTPFIYNDVSDVNNKTKSYMDDLLKTGKITKEQIEALNKVVALLKQVK